MQLLHMLRVDFTPVCDVWWLGGSEANGHLSQMSVERGTGCVWHLTTWTAYRQCVELQSKKLNKCVYFYFFYLEIGSRKCVTVLVPHPRWCHRKRNSSARVAITISIVFRMWSWRNASIRTDLIRSACSWLIHLGIFCHKEIRTQKNEEPVVPHLGRHSICTNAKRAPSTIDTAPSATCRGCGQMSHYIILNARAQQQYQSIFRTRDVAAMSLGANCTYDRRSMRCTRSHMWSRRDVLCVLPLIESSVSGVRWKCQWTWPLIRFEWKGLAHG